MIPRAFAWWPLIGRSIWPVHTVSNGGWYYTQEGYRIAKERRISKMSRSSSKEWSATDLARAIIANFRSTYFAPSSGLILACNGSMIILRLDIYKTEGIKVVDSSEHRGTSPV
jgi:hypothetical protein